jgi:GT2 family glycosyltransferase
VGFPVACNLGIKASLPRNDIVLLNDDIIIDIPNWLSVLQQGNGDLVGNQGLFGYGTWINGVPIQFEGISFACVLIRRKVLNVIGLLDESFSPGQGEDAEFCYRVERAGFSICYVELPMFHKGGQSFDMDTYKRQLELWTSKMANRIQSDLATCMGPWRCEEHRDVNNWIHCTQCLHNFNIWHTSNKWTWMQ